MDESIALQSDSDGRRTPLSRLEADLAQELLRRGHVDDAGLAAARESCAGVRLSTRLWELGLVAENELRESFSSCLRVPIAHPEAVAEGAPEHVDLLPREDAEAFRVVAYATRDAGVLVATCEPWRLALFEDLGEQISRAVHACFLDEAPLARILEDVYGLPADPRFRARPDAPTRDAAPISEEAEEEKEAAVGELMSETQFDRMYQR